MELEDGGEEEEDVDAGEEEDVGEEEEDVEPGEEEEVVANEEEEQHIVVEGQDPLLQERLFQEDPLSDEINLVTPESDSDNDNIHEITVSDDAKSDDGE